MREPGFGAEEGPGPHLRALRICFTFTEEPKETKKTHYLSQTREPRGVKRKPGFGHEGGQGARTKHFCPRSIGW